MHSDSVLEVTSLRIAIAAPGGPIDAVRGISFTIKSGQTLGIVGESGSGKTLTARSILGLLPIGSEVTDGSIMFKGQDLRKIDLRSMREIRLRQFGYISQDPHTTLHPSFRVGNQIVEGLVTSRRQASAMKDRAIEILGQLGLANASQVLSRYPHELSGGMKQRVAVATALIREPALIIADEPTSALDVTVQVQLLRQLVEIRTTKDFAMMFISHDIGLVSNICDWVAIIYGGEVVEYGPASVVIDAPRHPYTRGLLASVLRLSDSGSDLHEIHGHPVLPSDRVGGCRFSPRCASAYERCYRESPELRKLPGRDGAVACWRSEET